MAHTISRSDIMETIKRFPSANGMKSATLMYSTVGITIGKMRITIRLVELKIQKLKLGLQLLFSSSV